MKRRPLPYGFHYNIPTAFDPSVSYDMQYQRLREIVYSIIDNMEIHIPYMIFTTEAHTNDVVTLTGSFYTDHKEVLANKTFSLKGLPDGTYYININAKYKFEPCEPDCSCVKAISPDSDMTLETVYMPDGGITLYTVVRKNGEITAVNYNDIYTGMHNIAPDAHENRFSDVYAKIKAEVDRATAAEETLQHNIDNETARAMDAENVLDEKIKAEQNRATAAEHTLQDNINKEQARAEQAEATLQANITAEKNRATTAEDGLQKAIDAERTRAVAAENNLQKNIDNEVANRTAADTAERERAVNAENELAGDIASESADRQRADTALETKLTGLVHAEETRATQAEGDIRAALNTEETARMNADSKEINDRTAADTALGKRIDTEVSNRTAADTAERDRAVAAEENLQTQLNTIAEVGPGHKQNIFCKVTATKAGANNYILYLSDFGFWDKEKNAYHILDKSNNRAITLSANGNYFKFAEDVHVNSLSIVNDAGASLSLKKSPVTDNFFIIESSRSTDAFLDFFAQSSSLAINMSVAKINADDIKVKAVVGCSITAPNLEFNSSQGLITLSDTKNGQVVLRGVANGAETNDAVNKSQLDAKQDKLTLGDTVAVDQVSVNSVIVRGEDGAGFISRVDGAIKVSDNDSTTPIEITNVKRSSNNTSAATYGQVYELGSNLTLLINAAKDTANTASATAESAQNDINALKPRVDALEANYTEQTITLQTSNITIQSGGNTVDGVNISAKRINGNVYSIMGYFTFNATGSVGSFKIKVPNKNIKTVYHEITCNSAPVDDDFTTLLNSYSLSADGGISCNFGAKRQTTVNIAVTAIVEFE